MSVYEQYLLKRDNGVRRRVEIDITLYSQLEELSKIYDASINKLVNIAIIDLIKTHKIDIYNRPDNEITEPHNFVIRETSYRKLEKMKSKYGLSIFKLINIAIYNAINNQKTGNCLFLYEKSRKKSKNFISLETTIKGCNKTILWVDLFYNAIYNIIVFFAE